MMYRIAHRLRSWLPLAVFTASGALVAIASIAQTPPPLQPTAAPVGNYPACQPPNPGEYLLLVVSKTTASQEQVRRSLPSGAPTIVCNYLNDVVTRVSGFTTVETANAWARYLNDSTGLAAFVVRPAEAPSTARQPVPITPTPVTQPSPVPSTSPAAATPPTAYNPQPLGAGYAVLVDYFNQPAIAGQVQRSLGKSIGLVSYGQRPYLLAIYSTDPNAVNTMFQTLTNQGFWTVVVDSRRVTLLTPAIVLPQSTPAAKN
ncbi:SPOR domain-containing protein [Pantanalinema sp. GBBB05]|uniref:SPOR domain-containing protein n=1 Tax=Pantanalinema sp. GBBB05 TaxID=2604139 RepID=UPI003D817369